MPIGDHYVLDEQGNPVPTDLLTWARWFEDVEKRRLALTNLPNGGEVSTVFLGLNHGWGEGPPLLWETMVFDVEGDDTQERWSTRDEALAGHEAIVARLTLESPAPPRTSGKGG